MNPLSRSGALPFISVFFLLLATVCCGCTRDQAVDGGNTGFTDAIGRKFDFHDPPTRLVTIAPSVTEIVYAAGGIDRVVGVSSADDYPSEVNHIPRFSALPVNFEVIVSLRPDLILGTTQVNSPTDADTFNDLHLKVFYLKTRTLEDIVKSVRTVGILLHTTAVSDSMAFSLQHRIDSLRLSSDAIERRPRVLFLISDETLYSFGKDSYIHELITLAGGVSISGSMTTSNPVLSDEFVLSEAPEVIIGTFGENYDAEDLRYARPIWRSVPAVRQNRVYSIDADLVLRAGPRVVDGAYRIAEILQSVRNQ